MRKVKKLRKIPQFMWDIVRVDTFENRFSSETGQFFLFNPWSGETIFDMNNADRVNSAWKEPDTNVEKRTGFSLDSMQQLYPVYYASRTRGMRKFSGYSEGPERSTKRRHTWQPWCVGFSRGEVMRRYHAEVPQDFGPFL